MDGYLEDPLNRTRILELWRVLLSSDESDLIQYLAKYDTRYLLLDRIYFLPTCRRLNLPWQDWLEIQANERYTKLSLKPAGVRNNYLKCLFAPGNLKKLRVVFNSGNYVVLQRDSAP